MKKTKKPITDKIIKKITKTKTKKVSLKDVISMIEKWSVDNEVAFVGSFASFDMNNKKDIIKESELICFGHREEIEAHLEAMSEMLDEEKDDFINW